MDEGKQARSRSRGGSKRLKGYPILLLCRELGQKNSCLLYLPVVDYFCPTRDTSDDGIENEESLEDAEGKRAITYQVITCIPVFPIYRPSKL